jgi:hypothetical protein
MWYEESSQLADAGRPRTAGGTAMRGARRSKLRSTGHIFKYCGDSERAKLRGSDDDTPVNEMAFSRRMLTVEEMDLAG